MAKSNVKSKPISQEEYTTNKVLSVFSICLLGVLMLMVLQRLIGYGSTWAVGMMVCKALIVVGVLGVLWSLYLMMQERSGKRSAQNRVLSGRNVLIVSVVMVLMLSIINFIGTAPIKAFYVILPALAVYYLIYHSYAPEFFVVSINCGAAAALSWVVHRALISSNMRAVAYVAVAVMAVMAVLELAAVSAIRAKKGKIELFGRKAELQLSKNAYIMLTATPIVMTVLVAAAAFGGASAYLVCVGAAAAYLFITAVYYTVKLM